MIKRARSVEVGSLKLFGGISRMSFGFSVLSDILRQSDSASLNRCRQALPTGQEKTEWHSESSSNFRDCIQQKRQACGFWRKICTLSNAGRALFRIQTHYRFIQELQRRNAVRAAHASRKLAFSFFLRAARRISESLHFFHATFAARNVRHLGS